MLWIFAAFAAPALWAATNVIDEELLHHRLKDAVTLTAITGLFAGIPGLILFASGNVVAFTAAQFVLAALAGIVSLVAYIPYYMALKDDNAADVLLFWNLTPVLVALLAWAFARETLSATGWIAIFLLVAGSMIAMRKDSRGRGKLAARALALMIVASLLVAAEVTLAKVLFQQASFGAIFGLICLTKLAISLLALGVRQAYMRSHIGRHEMFVLAANETMDAGASSLKAFALSIGPAGIVQAIEGIQPLFVALLESMGFDGVSVRRSRREIVHLLLAVLFSVAGLTLIIVP